MCGASNAPSLHSIASVMGRSDVGMTGRKVRWSCNASFVNAFSTSTQTISLIMIGGHLT